MKLPPLQLPLFLLFLLRWFLRAMCSGRVKGSGLVGKNWDRLKNTLDWRVSKMDVFRAETSDHSDLTSDLNLKASSPFHLFEITPWDIFGGVCSLRPGVKTNLWSSGHIFRNVSLSAVFCFFFIGVVWGHLWYVSENHKQWIKTRPLPSALQPEFCVEWMKKKRASLLATLKRDLVCRGRNR